jgi:transposase
MHPDLSIHFPGVDIMSKSKRKQPISFAGPRFFGIDLAKRESQLCVMDAEGNILEERRFPTTVKELEQIAAELTTRDTVTFEMTTNSFAIARLIRYNSPARVIVSNPMKTKLIASARVKTDKIDARVLCELARVGFLPEVWLPDEETESLRRLVSRRTNLVRRRTAIKNDVHSILHRNLVEYDFSNLFGTEGRKCLGELIGSDVLDEYERDRQLFNLAEITRLQLLIDDLDACIAAFIQSRAALSHQLDLLLSIPGVSLASGAAILAAIGDVARFRSRQRLASYLGLTSRVKQSGDKCRLGRISKKGNSYARFMLVESADNLRKSTRVYWRFYDRIKKTAATSLAGFRITRNLLA